MNWYLVLERKKKMAQFSQMLLYFFYGQKITAKK